MASSSRACIVNKCEFSSCAVCHCCQKDLCLDHLKEHRDQLNAKLLPFANQINTFIDTLEHFTPSSSSSFKNLEQWRAAAHETVDKFYEHMYNELFEQKKNKPLEKLHAIRNNLEQLIRKQAASHENINLLNNSLRSIEQEINNLQNVQINLNPLVIDYNTINQTNSSNRQQLRAASNSIPSQVTSLEQTDIEALQNKIAFQIFVQLVMGKKIFVTVRPLDTILTLKEKIQEREGIPPDNQRLTFMGKILRDDYTLATYDIQRQSTINLLITQINKKDNE